MRFFLDFHYTHLYSGNVMYTNERGYSLVCCSEGKPSELILPFYTAIISLLTWRITLKLSSSNKNVINKLNSDCLCMATILFGKFVGWFYNVSINHTHLCDLGTQRWSLVDFLKRNALGAILSAPAVLLFFCFWLMFFYSAL